MSDALDPALLERIADLEEIVADEPDDHTARFMLATELAKMSGPSYGKLAIGGEDLKALGVNPGPQMGKLIKELEELVIEDPTANTTENLLTEAKKRMR